MHGQHESVPFGSGGDAVPPMGRGFGDPTVPGLSIHGPSSLLLAVDSFGSWMLADKAVG